MRGLLARMRQRHQQPRRPAFISFDGGAQVLVMGLGARLAGAGMLTGVMAFTTPVRAGMLMGVWGMANLLGRAAGSIMGGVVVDGVQAVTGSALTAYSTVFLLEAVMLVIAFLLSYMLHIEDALAQKELAGFQEPRPAVSV